MRTLYYVDKQYMPNPEESVSYEIPVDEYYESYEQALEVCTDLNNSEPLKPNEHYVVCEAEEDGDCNE